MFPSLPLLASLPCGPPAEPNSAANISESHAVVHPTAPSHLPCAVDASAVPQNPGAFGQLRETMLMVCKHSTFI